MCLSKWYCSSLILLLPEGFITNIYSPKCSALEAGEIDPWLRALVALAEDLGLVPAFAWWFTTICNSSAKGPVPSSDLLKCQVHMVHIHTCRQNTRTHKTKISASLKKTTFIGTFTNSLKSISTFLELMFLIESAIAVLKNVLISQLYEKTCNLLNAEIVCSLPTPCLYWLSTYISEMSVLDTHIRHCCKVRNTLLPPNLYFPPSQRILKENELMLDRKGKCSWLRRQTHP